MLALLLGSCLEDQQTTFLICFTKTHFIFIFIFFRIVALVLVRETD